MLQGIKKSNPFRQQVRQKAKPLPVEYHSWYWNPNRVGVRFAPDSFASKLAEISDQVKICWHPLRERWCVFAKSDKVQHKICSGWKLLFVWEDEDEYLPLDERILAKIYSMSGKKWGNLYEYWLKVEQAIERDRERAERSRIDDVRHSAGEYYDYTLIKNIGSGNKFVNNHSE